MLVLGRIYKKYKNSPLFEPKFVYGVLFGVASFSLVARVLLGYDLAIYQGQIHLQSLLWFSLEFALIYWRLQEVDNFKRLVLAFSFKAFMWEVADSFFILNAYLQGIYLQELIIYPDAIWYIQTICRNFTVASLSFIFMYKHINFNKSLAILFLIYLCLIIVNVIASNIYDILMITGFIKSLIFIILESLIYYKMVKNK